MLYVFNVTVGKYLLPSALRLLNSEFSIWPSGARSFVFAFIRHVVIICANTITVDGRFMLVCAGVFILGWDVVPNQVDNLLPAPCEDGWIQCKAWDSHYRVRRQDRRSRECLLCLNLCPFLRVPFAIAGHLCREKANRRTRARKIRREGELRRHIAVLHIFSFSCTVVRQCRPN